MLDTSEKKLPSFSNEPQQFGGMTLFLGQYGLTLHIPTDIEYLMRQGVNVRSVSEYYLNYEAAKTKLYMPYARGQFASIRQQFEGVERPISLEQKRDFLKSLVRSFAKTLARNRDNGHDLSESFCEAATSLGQALQARADVGMKTMTVIESGDPVEKFMTQRLG